MKVWIITDSKYPNPDAISVRIQFIAQLIQSHGHDVRVYSRSKTRSGENNGIPFVSLRGQSGRKMVLLWHYFYKMPSTLMAEIKRERPEIILPYSIPTHFLKQLIKMRESYRYRILKDCVEWYSKEESDPFTWGRMQYHVRNYWMKSLLPQNTEVIAISRFLETYFQTNHTRCIYIPSMCDCENVSVEKKLDPKRVTILYAGCPGKKDLFAPVFRAIKELTPTERSRFVLRIIGATKKDLLLNTQMNETELESFHDCLEILPRMPHDEILEQLKNAHFTILIRPENMRYAKAGFPTKVPESLVTGTPVICNCTSDLADFLVDGENAILSASESAESILAALKKAISIGEEEYNRMSAAARKTAETRFDYRIYSDVLNTLLSTEKTAGPQTF